MCISVHTECPAGFKVKRKESCYLFVNQFVTWFVAESYCQNNGGNLIAFETANEQEFIIDHLGTMDNGQ